MSSYNTPTQTPNRRRVMPSTPTAFRTVNRSRSRNRSSSSSPSHIRQPSFSTPLHSPELLARSPLGYSPQLLRRTHSESNPDTDHYLSPIQPLLTPSASPILQGDNSTSPLRWSVERSRSQSRSNSRSRSRNRSINPELREMLNIHTDESRRFQRYTTPIERSATAFDLTELADISIPIYLAESPRNVAFKLNNAYYVSNKDAIALTLRDGANIKYRCLVANGTINPANVEQNTPYYDLNAIGVPAGVVNANDVHAIVNSGAQLFNIVSSGVSFDAMVTHRVFSQQGTWVGGLHCQPGSVFHLVELQMAELEPENLSPVRPTTLFGKNSINASPKGVNDSTNSSSNSSTHSRDRSGTTRRRQSRRGRSRQRSQSRRRS